MSQIVPAILAEDVATAQAQLRAVESVAELVHIDVMDNSLVSRTTVSLADIRTLQPKTPLEIHFMVTRPEQYFTDAAVLQVQRVLIHLSQLHHNPTILSRAQDAGLRVGVVVAPDDEIEDLAQLLDHDAVTAVLVMGIIPGRSGQKMLPSGPSRLQEVRDLVATHTKPVHIGFDGGVHAENIAQIVECGANFVVVGSAIFASGDPQRNYANLVQAVS